MRSEGSTHEDQRDEGSDRGDGEEGGVNAVADRASVRIVGDSELDGTPEHGAHVEDHPAGGEGDQLLLADDEGGSAHQKRANRRPLVDSVA
jgi:hypothetical protein